MHAGAEALFADLGHFSVRAIQISTCCLVYPSLIIAYTGQASYLRKFPNDAPQTFYKSLPGNRIAKIVMLHGVVTNII